MAIVVMEMTILISSGDGGGYVHQGWVIRLRCSGRVLEGAWLSLIRDILKIWFLQSAVVIRDLGGEVSFIPFLFCWVAKKMWCTLYYLGISSLALGSN